MTIKIYLFLSLSDFRFICVLADISIDVNPLDRIEVRLNTDYLEHKAELDSMVDGYMVKKIVEQLEKIMAVNGLHKV